MKQILAIALALLLIAPGAHAYNEPSSPASIAASIKSQTGCSTAGYVWVPASNTCVPQTANASAIYGLSHFRTKLAQIRSSAIQDRVCFAGDSTTFGLYSNGSGTVGDLIVGSFPSQVTGFLNTSYGIKAERNSFIGDQGYAGGGGTYGTNDSRIVMGSAWSQDTAMTALGGDPFMATTSTNSLAFTPTTPVDTFKILYITQPGNGVLSVNVDGGTATTYNENLPNGVATATIAAGSLGTHTINFNWSSGGKVDVIGVYDAYDSSQGWVATLNIGWPTSKSTDWATNTYPWSPANPAVWAAIGCDATFDDLGINDWNNSVTPSNYTTAMQTLITAQNTGSTDLGLITPVPTNTSYTSVANQNALVAAMYGLVSSNNMALDDIYTQWGGQATVGAALGLYSITSTPHPIFNGYATEALSIAASLAATPGQTNNVALGEPYVLNNGTSTPLTINGPASNGVGISFNSAGGHTFALNGGGNGFGSYFYAADGTTAIWSASTSQSAVNSNMSIGFTSSSSAAAAADTAISRISAGILGVGTGAKGSVAGAIQASLSEQLVGSAIASASTIAPAAGIAHVTGTTAIATITPPSGMSSTMGGCLTLIADGAWTTTTAGNINAAMTATAGTPYNACYDGSKWYIK